MKPLPNVSHRVNILALPNQTTLLFGIMAAVILGAVLVGSIPVAPLSIRPLAVLLLILPIRSFLARPTLKYFRRYHRLDNNGFGPLQDTINELARDVRLSRAPELAIFQEALPLHTFGTFRHWYLAVNFQDAMRLQTELEQPEQSETAHARIYHELYHFKTGDYWQLGYARELLRLTFLVMFWAFVFVLGYGILLLQAQPDILALNLPELLNHFSETAPAEIQSMIQPIIPVLKSELTPLVEIARQKAATLSIPLVLMFAVSATYPFVILTGILWAIFWRKLWRVREFYADAGSVQVLGSSAPFFKAFGKTASFPEWPADTKNRWRGLKILLQVHPPFHARLLAIKNPALVFGTWSNAAVLAGSLALALEFLMMTPLTLLKVGNLPMHFPALTIFVIVALNYLLPAIAQGQNTGWNVLKIVGIVTAIRLSFVLPAVLVILLLLHTAPQTLYQMLSAGANVVARYAGASTEGWGENFFADMYRSAAVNIAQVAVLFVVLLGFLLLTAFFLRRVFVWYACPGAKHRLIKAAYGVIGMLGCTLGLTVLPIITAALLEPANLFNPRYLTVELFGLILTIVGIGIFVRLQRKYGWRCPKCGAKITGNHILGKRCDTGCKNVLHPWLIADYDLSEEPLWPER